MVPAAGIAIATTDVLAPAVSNVAANAVEGADNDTVVVVFNDRMIQSEVEMLANWSIESPVGTVLNPTAATIAYDSNSQQATVTFGAPDDINLQRDDAVQVTISNAR